MGNYPTYPAYKPSRIKWLDSLPTDWEEAKIRFFYDVQLGKMLQPQPTCLHDEEVPYLKALNVQWEKVDVDDLPTMWVSLRDKKKYAVKNGDLLVCEGGEVGRTAFLSDIDGDCIIQNALHRVRGSDRATVHYLKYLMRHIADAGWFDILCNKATIAHLTGEKFGALELPLPSVQEQQAIARFLDRKTAQIDALIAKKEALLAKLAEKRTALISQAVTRGLDPTAQMKDSGVPWLGEIPEHWEISRIGYLARTGNGSTPSRSEIDYWDGGHLPWLTSGKVHERYISYADEFVTDLAIKECHLPAVEPDSVLVAITGEGKTRGTAALVTFPTTISQHIAYITPDREKLNSSFLWLYLTARYELLRHESSGGGSTKAAITCADLRALACLVPPINEQIAIVRHIEAAMVRLDAVVEKEEVFIAKLKEYRTALITAAVTGKIDVRSLPEALPPMIPEMEAV